MTQGFFYSIFKSAAGWVGIVGSSAGLRCITLPRHSEREVQSLLGANISSAVRSDILYEDLIQRLVSYYQGNKVDFPHGLDFTGATPFQRGVWEATRLISYGETRSYAWVAEQIGNPRAVRAVGQALSKNPLPVIVPCHRVLTSNGRLGGFSGGLEMKDFLLRLEAESGTG